MAYHLHHTVSFFNALNEQLSIELYKKDVVPDDVTELLATSFSVNYPTGNGDKFDTIISCEARMVLYLRESDPQTFADFIVTFADEWKMIAYNDGQIIFVGFLTPGEGRAEFQDKPYDISLTAVDGLGLLKGVLLTKPDSSKFAGVNLIIDYLIAILGKTGLDLSLRLFSSIVEESMEDRTQNQQADTFNQTGLHARSFQKNPTEFYDCYTCLERILTQYFCIYQHFGMWVIVRIGELQESIGAKMWYTDYNASGTITNASQYLYDPAATGRDRTIHPVEVSQFIGSNFAVKSARYTYNYSVWPEIPTNNKFERGTVYEQGLLPDPNPNQLTYKKSTIEDWRYGVTNPTNGATRPVDGMLPTTDSHYRYSVYNRYGVEESREIVLERDSDPQVGHRFLMCEKIPVVKDSRINISIDFKTNQGGTGTRQYLLVMLEPITPGIGYKLDNAGGATPPDGIGVLVWENTSALQFLSKYYGTGEDASQYVTFNLEPPPLPISGNLYIIFMSYDAPMGRKVYYKNFSFEYYPSVAGSYAQVRGDYAQTSQNDRYKDAIDEEVFISDSTQKILQGTLYRENLEDLTTPTWRRLGVTETRHFKEIGELARFNNNYRRMWKIDGQYDGLKFSPAGNSSIIEPLSFHRQYAFPDSALLNGHYFVLVPPLNINYSEGRADMNFIEVLQSGANDGNDFGDNHIPIEYIFD
jgi:hypothetical protein